MPSSAPSPGAGTPAWGQPDYLVGGPGGQPPYRQPGAAGRGVKALVVATVLAVLVGGGALALYQLDPLNLFKAGPQAAQAVPANAVFYVGVDLEPSAEQKVAALRFLNHFPSFRNNAGLQDENADVRKWVFGKAFGNAGCDVSYDEDVAPWLGGKFGFAGLPVRDGSREPAGMMAVEVSDTQAAATGLKSLQNCPGPTGDSSFSFGFDFTGDYAVLAETQVMAEQFAASAADSALAADDGFVADMESLGDLGVATVWADVSTAVDLFAPPMLAGDEFAFLKTSYQRLAATFRFSGDSLEAVTSVLGDAPSFEHGDNRIVELPESTVFAVSEAGGGERLDASWDDILTAAGPDIDAQIAEFEALTGLAVPGDLRTVLGENLMIAVDSDGLTAEALQADDPSLLNAGVRFTSDPDELNAIYTKVLALLEEEAQQSLPFVKSETDDGIVLATNDSYAERLVKLGGGLGDSEQFQSVTENAASKELVLFFNWDLVEDQILEAAENAGASQEVIGNLSPLRAVGLTSGIEGDYTVSTFRLSVND